MNVFSINLEFTAGSRSYGNSSIVADDSVAIVRLGELVRLACFETIEITRRQSNVTAFQGLERTFMHIPCLPTPLFVERNSNKLNYIKVLTRIWW